MRKDSALPPGRWRSGDSGGCSSGSSSGGHALGAAAGSALRAKGAVAHAQDIEKEQVAAAHDVGERQRWMRLQRRLRVGVGARVGIGAGAGISGADCRLARAKCCQATRTGHTVLWALDDRVLHLVRIWLGVPVGSARSRGSV